MEKSTFSQLYLQLMPGLYNIAFSILRNTNDAQDAVQETALKAWLHIEHIRSDSVKAYITRILINECNNILRQRKRITPVPEIAESPSPIHPDLLELQDAVNRLPKKLRIAVLLIYEEGYSYKDASDALKLHPTALKSRIKRAKKLRKSQLIEITEEVL